MLTLESTLILLLETQRPDVLLTNAGAREMISNSQRVQEVEEGKKSGDIPELAQKTDQLASTVAARFVAIRLKAAANVAARKSGWPGACGRPDLPAQSRGKTTNSFNCLSGLNFMTPWIEKHQATVPIWTKIESPDGYVNVWRSPFQVNKRAQVLLVGGNNAT